MVKNAAGWRNEIPQHPHSHRRRAGGFDVYKCQQSLTGPGSLANSMQDENAPSKFHGGLGGIGSDGYGAKHDYSSSITPDDPALLNAAAKGDKNKVEKLLAGHSKVDSRDTYRRTPLMLAAWGGYDDVAERLARRRGQSEFPRPQWQ